VPVAGVRVMAVPAGSTETGALVMSNFSVADDAGRYRLENIPAGRYYIAAGRVDVPTFYPAALDRSKATAVSISAATPIAGIDITLQDVSGGNSVVRGGRGGIGGRGRGGPAPFVQVPPVIPPSPASPPTPVLPPNQAGSPFTLGRDFPFQNLPAGPALDSLALTLDRLVGSNSGAAWWTNTALVRRLGITEDQKKKIEAIFEQNRPMLVQTKDELEKQEAALARMLEADPMESTKAISAQIDRVIQARGNMERTNSGMTLEMRQILTRAQWVQLQMELPQGATGLVTVQPPRRAVRVAPAQRGPRSQQ